MKEYANVVKNCGIAEGKVLEDTRESTAREAATVGLTGLGVGPASPTLCPLMEIFLMVVTNLYLIPKKIFICYET